MEEIRRTPLANLSPKTLVLKVCSMADKGTSAMGPTHWTPALLTTTSMRPNRSRTVDRAWRTLSSDETSISWTKNRGSSCISEMDASERAVATTRQPREANSRASAWPMPPAEQPVITTTCFSSGFSESTARIANLSLSAKALLST
ncbi:N-acetylmuramoyl-L-alanine amidase [Striga asiatica]|uniref:N-acetylmuramoyl-L-alanine amidase n=1 Tax=Striga asiatica TaxID=4170 RepID=A0A5A7QQS0_STRAF|nr:N-acetylmuramoyl-L-alanine amidase [Striga asiatica]